MTKKAHNGSIVLMMLFLISTITIVLISTLRSQAHFIALAHEREEYEKNYNLAESLLKYGVKVYSGQKGHENHTNTDEETIRLDNWPHKIEANIYGIISIKNEAHRKIFRAELTKDNIVLISLQTALEK